jgi:hypothetical protein
LWKIAAIHTKKDTNFDILVVFTICEGFVLEALFCICVIPIHEQTHFGIIVATNIC